MAKSKRHKTKQKAASADQTNDLIPDRDGFVARWERVAVKAAMPNGSAAPVFITFQSASMGGDAGGETGFDQPGFGDRFFTKAGMNAIYVLASHNHWYQTAEVENMIAEVNRLTKNAARIVTYGSSMGAYAAIKFAPALRADAVIALSPQYSIDPPERMLRTAHSRRPRSCSPASTLAGQIDRKGVQWHKRAPCDRRTEIERRPSSKWMTTGRSYIQACE